MSPLHPPNRSEFTLWIRLGRLHLTLYMLGVDGEIEILAAGEHGPRRLDALTIMPLSGVPFLSISEYVRAKLKSWSM